RFHREHPDAPLIVALTGTDLYRDIRTNPPARQSLAMASRIVVLQPLGIQGLPARFRGRARVILQSAERPRGVTPPRKDVFDVCVMGHLRPVKDPFRAAKAARLLPGSS
ncbi:MAG: selenoneine biosynthesis selenosugar synthase SenB, partial [Terriglobia bacterium]